MWKVVRKGLWSNKIRYLLTAIAVVLGVAFISGTLVLTATIGQSFDDLFGDIYKGTDAVVRAKEVISNDFGSGASRPNVPESTLAVVQQVPSVQAAAGNVDGSKSYAQLVDKKGKAVGGHGPPTFGLAWQPNPTLNQFRIVGGRPPQRDNEIVIDRHSADTGDFKVGDRVKVLTSKRPHFYDIVGIARFGTADSLLGASISLFTLDEVQRISDSVGEFGEISVVAKSGVSQEQVKHDIQQALAEHGDAKVEVLTGDEVTKEQQDDVHKALSFFNVALSTFGFIALLVGGFIIYNTFSIIVAQRAREMALLRALGASERQVMLQVAGEAIVVGVLASAVGVAAGIALASGLRALMNAFGFSLPSTSLVIPPSAVIVGMVVGTVITFVSAFFPARTAARIPPIAALRDYSLERPVRRAVRFASGAVLLGLGVLAIFVGLFTSVDRAILYVAAGALLIFAAAFALGPLFARPTSLILGAPVARMRGVTGSLARENAARNPKRTTLTALPLVIGVALVGFITIFAASASATITHAVDTQFKTDFLVTSGSGFNQSAGFSPQLAASIGRLPSIENETGVRFGFAGINGKSIQLNASDPASSEQLVDFTNVAGKFSDVKNDGIAISKRKADEKGWKLGDIIPVTFVKTGTKALRVDYIYKENTFGDFFITTDTYGRNFDPNLDFLVLAKLKPGVSAKAGRAAIEPLLKPYPTAELQDNAQYKDDQVAQVNQLVVFIYALLFLSLFIALIGIANTLILSIHERTHEVGLLRAVGMGRSQVRSSIRWESVIICLIGTLNGLAIGLFFGWSFVRALKDEGFSQFAVAPAQLLVVVIVLALLSVLAAIFPARRASKLDILRAIATE
jgi:putative ABC transport system permease protein